MLLDLSLWDKTSENKWSKWKTMSPLDQLSPQLDVIFIHLHGFALMKKLKFDQRGWGLKCNDYVVNIGYKSQLLELLFDPDL